MSQTDEPQPKTRRFTLRRVALLLIIAAGLYALSGLTRSVGLHPVASCPKQTLTPTEANAVFQRGLSATRRDQMGEYYMMSSIYEGLPLLKEAARHGHREAMKEVRGHYLRQGAVEMLGFDGLSSPDASAEGMMWKILGAHLGEEFHPIEADVYRVLMDPSLPFPDGFFDSSTGVAWTFQMLTTPGLDWARQQAYAWRNCWPNPVPD